MYRKRKLLFLIESFIVGGAEKVLIDIVNHLDENKFDITVCSTFKKSVYKEYDELFNEVFHPCVHYKYLINNEIKWLYKTFNFLLARIPNLLYKTLIGDKYDYVIAFYEGLPTSWIASAKLRKGKKIAWLHTTGIYRKDENIQKVEKISRQYHEYDKIVAVSQYVSDYYSSLFSIKRKIVVIYNPIDIDKVRKKSKSSLDDLTIKKGVFTFVSVGRLIPSKGYDRILSAAKKLKEAGKAFQWWIIGGGADFELLQNAIQEYDIEKYVFLLGHKSNPYPYIKKADCFVMASYFEGLSISLLESLAIGTPVLSSDHDAGLEILQNGKYGMVFGKSEDDFVRKLVAILDDPQKLSSYVSEGLNRAVFFSFKERIKDFEKIVE